MTFFDLAIATGTTLRTDGDPDVWVSEYTAVISGEDDDGVVSEVGHIRAQRVHVEIAARHGASLFDVCDCHGQELHDLHALLFTPNGYDFRDALHRRFDILHADLFVLDYVVLDPKWRGLRVGLLAVRRLLDVLAGGCGLAVAHVAPLRRDAHKQLGVPASWLPAHETRAAADAATVKLRKHFRRMGFERLGRTPFYVLPVNEWTPTGADLLKPARPVAPKDGR